MLVTKLAGFMIIVNYIL